MVLTIRHKYSYYKRFSLDIGGFCKTDMKAAVNELLCQKDKYNKRKERAFTVDGLEKPYGKKMLKFMKSFNVREGYAIESPPESYILHSFVLSFFYKLGYNNKRKRRYRWRRYVYRLDVVIKVFRRKEVNVRFISIRVTRLYFLTLQDYQFRRLFRRAARMDGNLETNYIKLLEMRLVSVIYRTNYVSNLFAAMDFVRNGNVFMENLCMQTLNYIVPIGVFFKFGLIFKNRIRYYLKKRIAFKRLLYNIPRYIYMSHQFNYFYVSRLPTKFDLVYPVAIDIQRITGYY